MLLEHDGKRPRIHESAYVAPTSVVCGDVSIGENCRVLFGAVIVSEGGPVTIGSHCIMMENSVVRGLPGHPVNIGDHVLIGPRAYLTGCTVEENSFIARGATISNGARIGARAEIRINAVVQFNATLPPSTIVPVGWIAAGDPAEILSPKDHGELWSSHEPLSFPFLEFGLERPPPRRSSMPELTRRYSKALAKHKEDRILDEEGP